MEKIKIEQVKIHELQPAEYNPRKWDAKAVAQLKDSIERFGLIDPIIANSATERKNIVIGGHFRLHVAKTMGYAEVPVVYVNIPDVKKEMELNLRLNKNSGQFDFDLLANFDENILLDVGFSTDDMDKIFGLGADDEDDEEIEVPEIPIAKMGDRYQLGRHILQCGDSTNADEVEKLMGGVKANMVFTDPPYNVDYGAGLEKKREGIENDKMSAEQFHEFMDKALKNMLAHCDGVFYICMSSKELASLKDAFENNGGHWSQFLIWVKNTFTLSRNDWQNQYEPILYGWSKKCKNHYFVGHRDEANVWENLETIKPDYDEVADKTTLKLGDYHVEVFGKIDGRVCRKKDCVDIWREKKPSRSAEHPTMKPLKLVTRALHASSERNDIVLDLFGGSGSTLMACENTGRTCYTMEYDPKYVDVIIARWEKETGEKAKRI